MWTIAGKAVSGLVVTVVVLAANPATGSPGQAQDLDALRRQVAAQQQRIETQQKELAAQAESLKRQQEELDRQAREMAALAQQLTAISGSAAAAQTPATPEASATARPEQAPPGGARDAVGDLNAASVAAGDFPGAIRIPGTNRVSLAIGGFVKTVVIGDSNLEGAGPIFLPAGIGSIVPDQNGNASIDATLSRLNIDARAPTGSGGLRGYFEWDLNATNNGSPAFNLRHAYGTWTSSRGTLTLGHTWSTFMDLQILPEGLTEPTVSGAIFQRQAQLRWTQSLVKPWRFDVAIEDPSNRDVILNTPAPTPTRIPDVIAALQWDRPSRAHVRVTGLYRRLNIENVSANGWGISTGAHVNLFEGDKLALSASYGQGVGRYLLGVPGTLGGFIDPDTGGLSLVSGRGGLATYRHGWSNRVRSTFGVGAASIDVIERAPDDVFRRSVFGLANVMVSSLPYLTWGVEYQYGARVEKSGARQDNHRVIFGVQVF